MKRFKGVSELMRWIRDFSEEYFSEPVEFFGEVRDARVNRRNVLNIEVVETVKGYRSGSFTYQIPCQIDYPESILDELGIESYKEMEGELYSVIGKLVFRVTQNRYVVEVIKIEPYGKGAIEKRRQKILEKLRSEGLYPVKQLSSLLELGEPILDIAILASPNTRGLSDFLRMLQDSPLIPDFTYYPISIEGASAAKELVSALGKANNRAHQLIVIVRGGGAQGGLLYLDDESLARAVASSKLPVIVGIGHSEDKTLLDYVASMSFETPTAVGREISQINRDYIHSLSELEEKLDSVFSELLSSFVSNIQSRSRILSAYSIERMIKFDHQKLLSFVRRLNRIDFLTDNMKEALNRSRKNLISNSANIMNEKTKWFWLNLKEFRRHENELSSRIKNFEERITPEIIDLERFLMEKSRDFKKLTGYFSSNAKSFYRWQRERLQRYIAEIRSINPIYALVKGGAIVMDEEGKAIVSIEDVKIGDEVLIRLSDGSLRSEILEKITTKKKNLVKE
ncbi:MULTISPECIES: exodeoxyribonuclease VII large subunit [Kosmotoga]|uniref:Exodeoxyribonuclease 7 large subunit n=1 Tax=Kosmotoga olearia (strain ATCC BAA-1733 / DSM 21960 / TBF 19.5.1) TaxID=521045 RepID=C5CEQ2_KOSOT|nr:MULTISPECIES: exodeoxyribonuclease VII large subunit [Kosmotoga]ACR80232.1 Exodeoxyribonuclease VII [Kosmotoga olearia TBF 19.5.1]MDI3523483.1 exodeoxyribonuclease large subunit [Kosmotoga sp.]MDK2952974.1 exodeoxyribonuclease large subunit [Kosmotoga sp.]